MNDISFNGNQLAGPGPRPVAQAEGAAVPAASAFGMPMVMRYLRIAKRWKWLFIGTVSLSLIIGLIITLLMTPQYTATATLEIARESDRVVNVQGVEPEASPVDLEFYQTQYGLLKAETLAQRVATELRLQDDANFFAMFGDTKWADRLSDGPRGADAGTRNERIRAAGKILLQNVDIVPERLSRLVEVQFTSPDPDLSARIANTWTKAFIESSLGRRFEATSYARSFLEERLGQLRERLQATPGRER